MASTQRSTRDREVPTAPVGRRGGHLVGLGERAAGPAADLLGLVVADGLLRLDQRVGEAVGPQVAGGGGDGGVDAHGGGPLRAGDELAERRTSARR